jgi:hypothetical protein
MVAEPLFTLSRPRQPGVRWWVTSVSKQAFKHNAAGRIQIHAQQDGSVRNRRSPHASTQKRIECDAICAARAKRYTIPKVAER